MNNEIFIQIDNIIKDVNDYKIEPIFSNEIEFRKNRTVPDNLSENEMIEKFTTIIAYSQNANSKRVDEIIKTRIFNEIFNNFDIDYIIKMNPCDLSDKYWEKIKGIRQQAKLFHIVSLARKMKKIESINKILTETKIPKVINTQNDIDNFWQGFKELKKILEVNKVPFFRSTTSLLHFLLDIGYDCIKPDLVVMKVAKKIGIVEKVTGEKNLIKAVRTIQEYSVFSKTRPSIIDFYLLIDEGQLWAKQFINEEFYN